MYQKVIEIKKKLNVSIKERKPISVNVSYEDRKPFRTNVSYILHVN